MQFNINRFLALIRRDLLVYKKPISFVLGGAIILLFLISVLVEVTDENNARNLDGDFWSILVTIMLLGGGFLFTSVVFWEFREPDTRLSFLTLPASNFEKMISRWIYTLILYPIAVLVIVYLVYFACNLFFDDVSWKLEDFRQYLGPTWQIYLWSHSVLFMFSIWYNRYVAAKAAIASFLYFIVSALSAVVLFYLVFNNVFGSGFSFNADVNIEPAGDFQLWAEDDLLPVLRVLSWTIPTLFFLVVSYFKMKEKEV